MMYRPKDFLALIANTSLIHRAYKDFKFFFLSCFKYKDAAKFTIAMLSQTIFGKISNEKNSGYLK
jgi:hypothetical protein